MPRPMPRVDCGRGRLLPATAASAGGGGGGMAATDVAAAISGGGMAPCVGAALPATRLGSGVPPRGQGKRGREIRCDER